MLKAELGPACPWTHGAVSWQLLGHVCLWGRPRTGTRRDRQAFTLAFRTSEGPGKHRCRSSPGPRQSPGSPKQEGQRRTRLRPRRGLGGGGAEGPGRERRRARLPGDTGGWAWHGPHCGPDGSPGRTKGGRGCGGWAGLGLRGGCRPQCLYPPQRCAEPGGVRGGFPLGCGGGSAAAPLCLNFGRWYFSGGFFSGPEFYIRL